jgi:pyrroline-5-carboxylate reductase
MLAAAADGNGESPAQLRKKVTSPGGTTEAAIKVFAEGSIEKLISAAITRARDRARELSK